MCKKILKDLKGWFRLNSSPLHGTEIDCFVRIWSTRIHEGEISLGIENDDLGTSPYYFIPKSDKSKFLKTIAEEKEEQKNHSPLNR